MTCNQHHTFEIKLCCDDCGKKETILYRSICKNNTPGVLSEKRVGCKKCHTSLLMLLFCEPGRKDYDRMYPLTVSIKNLD